MYRVGTNVSDARKALKIKGFPGIEHVRGSAAIIVSGEKFREISGHSSKSKTRSEIDINQILSHSSFIAEISSPFHSVFHKSK